MFNVDNVEKCIDLLMEIYEHMHKRTGLPKLPEDLMEGSIQIVSRGYYETIDKGKGVTQFIINGDYLGSSDIYGHFFKNSKSMLEQVEKWHAEEMLKDI
jgi:hypothetical protein